MLPNPNSERQRLIKLAILFACATLYVVVTYNLWHYAFYG